MAKAGGIRQRSKLTLLHVMKAYDEIFFSMPFVSYQYDIWFL